MGKYKKKKGRKPWNKKRWFKMLKFVVVDDKQFLSFDEMKIDYCNCEMREMLMNLLQVIITEEWRSASKTQSFKLQLTEIVSICRTYVQYVNKDVHFAKILEKYLINLNPEKADLENPTTKVIFDTKMLIKLLYILNIRLSPYKALHKMKDYLNSNKVTANFKLIKDQQTLYDLYNAMIDANFMPDNAVCHMADKIAGIKHKNKSEILFTRDFIRYLQYLRNLKKFDEQVLIKVDKMYKKVLSILNKPYIHLRCLIENIKCVMIEVKKVIYNKNVEEQTIFIRHVSHAIKALCILLIHLTEIDINIIENQQVMYELYIEMGYNMSSPWKIFCKMSEYFDDKQHKNINEILCTRKLIRYLHSLHDAENINASTTEKIDEMYRIILNYVSKSRMHLVFLNECINNALANVKKVIDEHNVGDTDRFNNEISIAVKYLCVFLMQLTKMDINVVTKEFNILMYAIKMLDFIDKVLIPCNQQFNMDIYNGMKKLFNNFIKHYDCKTKDKAIIAYSKISLYIIQQRFSTDHEFMRSECKDERIYTILLNKTLTLQNYENGIDILKLIIKKTIELITHREYKKDILCLLKTLLSEGSRCQ